MKTIAFTLLMLVASATPFPSSDLGENFQEQRRDPIAIVLDVVANLIQRIKDEGLDPFEVPSGEVEYVLISEDILKAAARIENFRFSGLSNIVVQKLDKSPYGDILSFDIVLPQVFVNIGDASAEVNLLGNELSGILRGWFSINGLGISGRVRIHSGQNTVSVLEANARLRTIESAVTLKIGNLDLSSLVNIWLRALPENLRMHQALIDNILGWAIELIVNGRLEN